MGLHGHIERVDALHSEMDELRDALGAMSSAESRESFGKVSTVIAALDDLRRTMAWEQWRNDHRRFGS